MISKILYAFETGLAYVKNHPQILFALLLVLILPVSFLYSANQFLAAGQAHQERLENERIGLLHDMFYSLIRATKADPISIQSEIESITDLNPDILAFKVVKKSAEGYVPIASMYEEEIGINEDTADRYNLAFVRPDESIIDTIYSSEGRLIRGVRLVDLDEDNFVILTVTSRDRVDQLFAARKQSAYITLGILYLFILAIAYWLIRITDYRYLYREARQAIKTKDLFTNMIAHELRAPLTAIKGYASMITESKQLPDEEKLYASRITESSERLIAIVTDLLDVARIQSGKLKIEKSIADVSQIIKAVCDELAVSAAEKSIQLTHSGTETRREASIDEKRLHQVLTNLVSNAIKYTKEGTINLSVATVGDTLEIRVKDTGMGISAADQKQLFAPFFRVQSDDVSQITGTGLGMWITRQLIELMGATIGVESIKGVGTHVVVSVPKARQKTQS